MERASVRPTLSQAAKSLAGGTGDILRLILENLISKQFLLLRYDVLD